MSSYISHFRVWVVAGILFIAVETAVFLVWHPSPYDRTNFLQFSFARPETPQRLFVLDKLKQFVDSKPVIVQSGDSSGFYGIDPRVVMKHLPAAMTYLNMSCCANLGFRGYYNVLKFMAHHNPSVRYMVLHFTPYTMPRPETWDNDGAALWGIPDIKVFGDAVYQEFLSPWRFLHVPSLAFRRAVTDRYYYAAGLLGDLNRPLLDNDNYAEFRRIFVSTSGWMPETDIREKIPAVPCKMPPPRFFDFKAFKWKTYLEEILEAYADLAKSYHATLVVVFQPVACTIGPENAESRAIIDSFKRAHPEVEIPFPLIETWPSDLFSVPAHVRREHTDLIGNRLGQALAEIVVRHEARRPPLVSGANDN